MSFKKDLYVCKNMEELHARIDTGIQTTIQRGNPELFLSRGAAILPEGEKYYKEGDEEFAYIFFMSFLELLSAYQKTQEYARNNFNIPGFNGRQVRPIIQKTELLNASLRLRYKS